VIAKISRIKREIINGKGVLMMSNNNNKTMNVPHGQKKFEILYKLVYT